MTKKEYNKLLSWASERGYKLHKDIEYKIKNGIGGMYAKSDIKAFTPIYSGPSSVLDAWVNTPTNLEYTNDILVEYLKGDDSDIKEMFLAFESLDSFKESSIYFATESELQLLSKISSPVYSIIRQWKYKIETHLAWFKERHPNVSDDDILFIILNSESRAWGIGGFNPILDLFNHSNEFGMTRTTMDGSSEYFLGCRYDIKKGSQIYDSYGINDIFHYLKAYSFFDEKDYHYSNIVARLDFPLTTEIHKLQYEEVKKHFNTETMEVNGQAKFKVLDNDLFLTEFGPSHKMVMLVDILSRNTKELLESTKDMPSINYLNIYLEWFNILLNNTFITEENEAQLTDRLKPWYAGIKRDFEIIKKSKEWAIKTNSVLSTIGNKETFENYLESNK